MATAVGTSVIVGAGPFAGRRELALGGCGAAVAVCVTVAGTPRGGAGTVLPDPATAVTASPTVRGAGGAALLIARMAACAAAATDPGVGRVPLGDGLGTGSVGLATGVPGTGGVRVAAGGVRVGTGGVGATTGVRGT